MAEDKQKHDPIEVDDAEVAPLSDVDLDSVAGGKSALEPDCTGCNGTGCCTTGTDDTL